MTRAVTVYFLGDWYYKYNRLEGEFIGKYGKVRFILRDKLETTYFLYCFHISSSVSVHSSLNWSNMKTVWWWDLLNLHFWLRATFCQCFEILPDKLSVLRETWYPPVFLISARGRSWALSACRRRAVSLCVGGHDLSPAAGSLPCWEVTCRSWGVKESTREGEQRTMGREGAMGRWQRKRFTDKFFIISELF